MKAYTYKMKLVEANIFAGIIYVILFVITYLLNINFIVTGSIYFALFFVLLVPYLFLHELLHGIGYYLGGAKRENITYGIALEKGLLYALCKQEITKSNILISLQMPFMVIGVITYIIGAIFNIPMLVFLSIINLGGAAMDIVMFIYILRIKKVRYSESGGCDEFVLISDEDLTKRKSMFFKIIETKKYDKNDFVFKEKSKKITVSKSSIIYMIILLLIAIVWCFI